MVLFTTKEIQAGTNDSPGSRAAQAGPPSTSVVSPCAILISVP